LFSLPRHLTLGEEDWGLEVSFSLSAMRNKILARTTPQGSTP
jgi:hypothetical protein